MQMKIRGREASPGIHEHARRRFEFALGRFGGRIQSLTISLADLNGPRGGVDKRCLAIVRLVARGRTVVVEDTDASLAVAVDRAADRMGRAVARAVRPGLTWSPAPMPG
ncbi:MAG: HPF/RaiA family ribosome-associated protein [Acidobacteria bacterium]|nr:HPF/RaiA family ribosome-associated protein [Acidobacteriota bacterium]